MKARIEEFYASPATSTIHKGMTSRDLTENVEQLQIRAGARAGARAGWSPRWPGWPSGPPSTPTLVMTGRSHNVPAQATTLGKRFANAGEELLLALRRLDDLIARYPLRGIKGPVGTQQDSSTCSARPSAVDQLEAAVAEHLGFTRVLDNVGQVYPRSLDLDVVAALVQVAAGPVEPGHDDPPHGRPGAGHRGLQGRPGRLVGHAAQDEHPLLRADQRLQAILGGHLDDGRGPGGRPVERGRRVSCSVVRRVALPDAFFAARRRCSRRSSPCSTTSAPTPRSSTASCDRYLPFLTTTKVLMAAVRAGVGREAAHEAIKEHAVAVALAMREKGVEGNDLLDRLAADDRARPRRRRAVADVVADPLVVRRATRRRQVAAFVAAVEALVAADPDAAAYRPAPIL